MGRSTEIGKKEQQVSWGQRQDKDKAGKASHHVLPLRRHRGTPGIQSTMCCHYGDIEEPLGVQSTMCCHYGDIEESPGIQSTMCCHYGDIEESPGSPVHHVLPLRRHRGIPWESSG